MECSGSNCSTRTSSEGSLVQIQNVASMGKLAVPKVTEWLEPDLLYPLLRWSDVGRYRAAPKLAILLVQDVARRSGIDETLLATRFPRTYEFLKQFSDVLRQRTAYRRYQARTPFYSMYNIGSYTVAPNKVVWRRMDRRLNAVAVGLNTNRFLGPRSIVPQETCVLIETGSEDESHYLERRAEQRACQCHRSVAQRSR